MSAILSADDLNDFISPGVACIKPVETLPQQQPRADDNIDSYEVTTEEKIKSDPSAPSAQISLTDCLACSGCVTSAEAVLVSLQSHNEVLETLDRHPTFNLSQDGQLSPDRLDTDARIFVASVSPQARASLAATYGVSEEEAGCMIQQLLAGPQGLRGGGKHGSHFSWIVDTNKMRQLCLVAAADEVCESMSSSKSSERRPILTSACPGWICYAEKTHPHILPSLSSLKSPQALTGLLFKTVLAKQFGVSPDKVWHLAVMPCFDKKLEASRAELTSDAWDSRTDARTRDVDCVITARELLMMAESREISFPSLSRLPVERAYRLPFPDPKLDSFLFSHQPGTKRKRSEKDEANIGTSGGYLHHVLKKQQHLHPGSTIRTQRGRNADVSDYVVLSPDGAELFRAARYYGFRNIQNLVRRLKPAKTSKITGAARRTGSARRPGAGSTNSEDSQYRYVEVMACPGGCTNGGGQIKVGDVATLRQVKGTGVENGSQNQLLLPQQREWLAMVDEAYWSAETEESDGEGNTDDPTSDDRPSVVDGIDHDHIHGILKHWSELTSIEASKLLCTTYRVVESDVGKAKSTGSEMDRVASLAVAAGGGW